LVEFAVMNSKVGQDTADFSKYKAASQVVLPSSA